MAVRWAGYETFDPGVDAPLHELPREQAQAAYDRLMAAKDARLSMLTRLLAENGVALDYSDAAVQRLNDWFRAEVREDPESPGRLAPVWYSVVSDVGLFLGEAMIARDPHLHWELWTHQESHISYQRHVVTGFRAVPDPHYAVDTDLLAAILGHRVIAGKPVNDTAFVAIVTPAEASP